MGELSVSGNIGLLAASGADPLRVVSNLNWVEHEHWQYYGVDVRFDAVYSG